ncbi:MAG: TetR/AcrR family transcriptional regulator [Proteobacteria bacterium]|nr:TetR/AcrR family transcriptional regulator [Pseudomonadota bacterium]
MTAETTSKQRRTRSLATRLDIVEATIDCFVDIGYVRATTTEIAKKANVTRGAVQHYFPTTQHVLESAVSHLRDKWMEAYHQLVKRTPAGADYIDGAVDNMWTLVNSREFVAWMELVAAARTDPELQAIIQPAARAYENARRDAGQKAYQDFALAELDKFEQNRDTTRFLLEGMALTMITYDKEKRVKAQLDWIKDRLHEAWLPERARVRIQG